MLSSERLVLSGGSVSLLGSTVSLLSNTLTGVLGLPYCFSRCGLLLGSALVAGVAVSQLFTLRLLVYACAVRNIVSYEELVADALGAAARPACLACVLALQFGCLVAFFGVLADTLTASVLLPLSPGADLGRAEGCAGIVLLLLPLVILARDEAVLARASLVSVVFLCGFTAATLLLAADAAKTHTEPIAMWQPQGALLALPVLVFAMTGHSSLFPCLSTLRHPTVARTNRLLTNSMTAAACLYAGIGAGGYLTFRRATAGNLLRNFAEVGGVHAAAARHLKLGFALSIAGAVPITSLPVRDALLDLVLPQSGAPTMVQHAAISTAVLCLTMLFALALPNVELVFALTGATGAVAIAYIFPATVFLQTLRRRKQDAVAALLKEMQQAPAGAINSLWSSQEKADRLESEAALAERAVSVEAELFGPLAGSPARVLSWTLLGLSALVVWICTAATLRAVSEEATVVSLAQTMAHQAAVHAATTPTSAHHDAGAHRAAAPHAGDLLAAESSRAASLPSPDLLERAREVAVVLEAEQTASAKTTNRTVRRD